jgi:GT2 family glycosyltransferase
VTARVSVIIVNYNGREFLGELFDSLARQTRPADEVVMVDNASADDSVTYTCERFPWVQVIPLTTNVGFAEGNNVGVANARGEYLALLNSDAVADDRWVEELVRALDGDPRIGAAMGKIYRASAYPRIEQVGAEFNNIGNIWGRGFNEFDEGQFETACEVPALTACAALVRRRALADESLFDRQFFMYHEELDLSLRLRGRGYSIVYVPSAMVHHKGMQSVKRASPQPRILQQYYCNRNRLKILTKYYPAAVLLRSLPLIVLSLVYWNAVFLRHGGPCLFLRAITSQLRFAFQGLFERLRGGSVRADSWLPWMTRQRLRDMLALRAALAEVP